MTTSARLLKLLSLLQTRRDWPGEELAGRLEVSCRTIRRDVERLRELGYPVDALTGPSGGYRLEAGTAMPPLLLDDDEAVAIAVGLRTAAGAAVTGIEETSIRALVKLEQVLPNHLRRRVNALGSVTDTMATTGPTVDPACLTAIAGACRDGQRLRFLYRARDAAESRREVEPHRLVMLGRRWYLVAWDTRRSDWRTFRVDRISEPASTGVRFEARGLPGGDATAYVRRSISGAVYRYQARVTLAGAGERAGAPAPAAAGDPHGARRGALRAARPPTTTSTGWRCGSGCSASRSRCTSRPSSSRGCASSGSGAPAARPARHTARVTTLLTALAAAVAVAVELIEAMAIVLAVGVSRRWRDAVWGGVAGVVACAVLAAALGPLLVGLPTDALRLAIGTLLLLYGLEWLRKGVLRLGGRKRALLGRARVRRDRRGARGRAAAARGDRRTGPGRVVAFKGVLLEGVEVVVIVAALAARPTGALPALLGAGVAAVVVAAVGVRLRAPLSRVPETELKYGVGVLLTTFGIFFAGEGLQVDWPGGDAAILAIAAVLVAVTQVRIRGFRHAAVAA